MKPNVEEADRMLRMAQRDLKALQVLITASDVHFSILCFHARQVVEKCFKAALFCREIEFRRTHDLALLAALMLEQRIAPPLSEGELALLGPCAVQMRYDDMELDLPLLTPDDLWRIAARTQQWTAEIVRSLKHADD